MELYLETMCAMKILCDDFKETVLQDYFKESNRPSNPYFYWSPLYRQYHDLIKGVIDICDMMGVKRLEEHKGRLLNYISFLIHRPTIEHREEFEKYVDWIKVIFSSSENEIVEKICTLHPDELDRLNEAIHCFLEGCYYSTIVMSVSATEFRLLSLMKSQKPDSKLEKLTLGQLIEEYLGNKKEYNNVISEKHEPLLKLCNTYRIFSVHPKKEKITKRAANSILNLTFEFLMDKEIIKKRKLRIEDYKNKLKP